MLWENQNSRVLFVWSIR